jgi:hypothetical protein
MARYKTLSWRDIPTTVRATDGTGASATRQLPPFFQQEIDRMAMAEGIVDSDAYLDAWGWSAESERDGSAVEVAEAVATELAASWHREHRQA